jgi:hypothetical protein
VPTNEKSLQYHIIALSIVFNGDNKDETQLHRSSYSDWMIAFAALAGASFFAYLVRRDPIPIIDDTVGTFDPHLIVGNEKTNNSTKKVLSLNTKPDYHDVCDVNDECECKSGFKRKGFKGESLQGKLPFHTKHVFICSGQKSTEWVAKVE